MKTRKGKIFSVPHLQALNDIPQIVAWAREGVEFADMTVDAFEVMHDERARRPLVMGVALRAFILGWPHRLRRLARALRHILRRARARA